ncbi:MAG: hypothetical protein CMF70_06460 [Magnetovibrio sp.]|nr:hypothetical protein [Magnetovibrio sp.]
MLEAIRKRTGSIIVKSLAGLLIISFGAWGVGDFLQQGISEEVALEVGDTEITPLQVENEIHRELNRFQRQSGTQLDRQQLKAFGFGDKIVQRLINVAALDLEVANMGLEVSKSTVAANIHSNPIFSGVTGKFDKARFNQILQAEGFTEEKYIAEVHRELGRLQLLSSVGQATYPRLVAEEIFRIENEKRLAEVLVVEDIKQQSLEAPDDQVLLNYYNEHKELFTSPETRNISYVRLSVDQLADGILVTDEEIQKYFEDNEDEFFKPEKRFIRQFILNHKKAANEVENRLANGSNFVEVAKEFADQEPEDLNLGMLSKNDLPISEVGEAAFSLSNPGIAKVVQSSLGFHFVEVTEIKLAEQKTIEQARKTIVPIIQHEKGIDSLFELSNKLEDILGSGATLEEAAVEVGTTLQTISGVDRTGNNLDGNKKVSVSSIREFIEIAFSTDVGIESSLTEDGEDGYFILRVDSISKASLTPFSIIRKEVVDAYMIEARQKASEAMAKDLVERVMNGNSIKSVASIEGKEFELVGPLTRSGNGEIEENVVRKIFELKVKGAGIARINGGYKVIQVTKMDIPDSKSNEETVTSILSKIQSSHQDDLVVQLIEGLRSKYGVLVNNNVIDLLFRPGGYRANRS